MEHEKLKSVVALVKNSISEYYGNNLSLAHKYKMCCDELLDHCIANNVCIQKQEDFNKACLECSSKICRSRRKLFRKVAFAVSHCLKNDEFYWPVLWPENHPVPEAYQPLLNQFKADMTHDYASETVRFATTIAKFFLRYLDKCGIESLSELTPEIVMDYVQQITPHTPPNVSCTVMSLKKFLAYLNRHGISEVTEKVFILSPARPRKKVLPRFTDDEISRILSVIDLTTAKGMRDYAIIVTALGLGLRASDMVKLKLGDINWRTSTVSIVQKKTADPVTLPLPVDVGNALTRYILHARPKVDSPYVFLRSRLTHRAVPLSPATLNPILQAYMKDAGIDRTAWDGLTFHALRRTTGTRLVESGAALPVVSQLLGHKTISAAKRYISLDVEHLRTCCLDLGFCSTAKEGLR